MNEAFRAAHTIKGVCQNLSLDPLYKSASELAERLRNGQEYAEDVEVLVEQVKKDYTCTVDCIRELADSVQTKDSEVIENEIWSALCCKPNRAKLHKIDSNHFKMKEKKIEIA